MRVLAFLLLCLLLSGVLNLLAILGIQAAQARRAPLDEAFRSRRGGALAWWILGGWLVGATVGYSQRSEPADEEWGPVLFFLDLLVVPLVGAAAGGFAGGACPVFRRGVIAGLMYFGVSVLVVVAAAAGAIGAGLVSTDFALSLALLLFLFSPTLWATIAAWSIRRA